jgi:hypothetical protein
MLLKRTFLLAAGLLTAASAQALTIGTLGNARTNAWLPGGSDYSEIRSLLNADGHTLVGSNSIDGTFLGGVDVFLTSTFEPFFALTGPALTAEVSALTNWVSNGGTVIFSGEHGGFTSAFNSYTTAFGITMGGVAANYNTGVSFATDASDPYLANGVSGSGWAVNNRGWIASVTGSYTTLATSGLNPSELFAVSKQFGQGTVVAFADTYFMHNAADPDHMGRQFLLNAINQHGANVAPVPEPETYAMMLAGLGLLGVVARRRKQKSVAS